MFLVIQCPVLAITQDHVAFPFVQCHLKLVSFLTVKLILNASLSIWEYAFSALVKVRDAYAIGRSVPSSITCESTAPIP